MVLAACSLVVLGDRPVVAEEKLAASLPAAIVRFQLVPPSAAKEIPSGRLILRSLVEKSEPVVVQVLEGKPAEARLPQGSLWEVSTDIPGWWVKPAGVRLPVGKTAHDQELPLWRTATVTGALVPPTLKATLPKEVTIAFGSLSGRLPKPGVPQATVSCPVADDRSFRCTLPAAGVDMAVRVAGFVPHYRWGVRLEPGKALALGRLDLKPGASLAGRVETEDGSLPSNRCVARLAPIQAPGSEAFLAGQLQGTTTETAVGVDGFFQLTDLRPGAYLLEVQQPGFAPARVRPVEIQAGQEARLAEAVVLRKPLSLEFAVQPARDWLKRPWSVRIYRISEATGGLEREPVFNAPVNQEGVAAVPGQTVGQYWVTVFDSRGNGMFSDHIDVAGAADSHHDIEIEIITVQGTLKLGKEPLAGSLAFGGKRGAVSFTMEADEDGHFIGVLPREGFWPVDVKTAEPRIETHTKVEIRADRLGRAKVDVSLPNTRLFGRVLTEDGKPAPDAKVEVSSPLNGEDTRTDEKGEFSFRALPPGPSQLAASRRMPNEAPATSEWTFLTVADDQEAGPIELRLRRVKPFAGRVEALRGPVAGATVRVIPSRPMLGFGEMKRTGLDGSFAAEIPGRSEVLQVVVAPPGMGLKTFEIEATEQKVVLFVTEERGTLEVEVPFSDEDAAERDLRLTVFQNGLPLGLPELRGWAQAHGVRAVSEGRFAFPALAPGDYRVCVAQRGSIPDWAAAGYLDAGALCAAGALTDGGTLRLKIAGEAKPAS
jgi:hypothetical protein